MSEFDRVSSDFDRFRALPPEITDAIRGAIREAIGVPRPSILEVGAGTGRIGSAFLKAGEPYVGVDDSSGMLAKFAEKTGPRLPYGPPLVQGDGRSLPFARGTFDGVLFFHVLGATPGWRRILVEGRRVLRPSGSIVIGRVVSPPSGIDARMRGFMAEILSDLGHESRRRGASQVEAMDWLARDALRNSSLTVARWKVDNGPREFLARRPTGARFVGLPEEVRTEVLARLAERATAAFGSLDHSEVETRSLELDVFTY
jgi:ubiquinone/menaquinone biosynthesis C-methylase UbiE